MKGLEKYDAKILLAWGEAISGNNKIRDWLTSNGYPELGVFCFALRNKQDARKWLYDNKQPHLMALINASEGNVQAEKWLKVHGYEILFHIARHVEAEMDSVRWLKQNHPFFSMLAIRIETVKQALRDDNLDPHKINPT